MTSTSYLDPSALMRVKSLELRARMVMEGFWKGLHRSPYHGFSVEFSEYRPYVRGDDPRFLDWKVMARSDRAFIKKFEDENQSPRPHPARSKQIDELRLWRIYESRLLLHACCDLRLLSHGAERCGWSDDLRSESRSAHSRSQSARSIAAPHAANGASSVRAWDRPWWRQ